MKTPQIIAGIIISTASLGVSADNTPNKEMGLQQQHSATHEQEGYYKGDPRPLAIYQDKDFSYKHHPQPHQYKTKNSNNIAPATHLYGGERPLTPRNHKWVVSGDKYLLINIKTNEIVHVYIK